MALTKEQLAILENQAARFKRNSGININYKKILTDIDKNVKKGEFFLDSFVTAYQNALFEQVIPEASHSYAHGMYHDKIGDSFEDFMESVYSLYTNNKYENIKDDEVFKYMKTEVYNNFVNEAFNEQYNVLHRTPSYKLEAKYFNATKLQNNKFIIESNIENAIVGIKWDGDDKFTENDFYKLVDAIAPSYMVIREKYNQLGFFKKWFTGKGIDYRAEMNYCKTQLNILKNSLGLTCNVSEVLHAAGNRKMAVDEQNKQYYDEAAKSFRTKVEVDLNKEEPKNDNKALYNKLANELATDSKTINKANELEKEDIFTYYNNKKNGPTLSDSAENILRNSTLIENDLSFDKAKKAQEDADLLYAQKLQEEENNVEDNIGYDNEDIEAQRQELLRLEALRKQKEADEAYAKSLANNNPNRANNPKPAPDLSYLTNISNGEKYALLKSLDKMRGYYNNKSLVNSVMNNISGYNPESVNKVINALIASNTHIKDVIRAFNYPKIDKKNETAVDYANKLMTRTTNLEINPVNAELITLASFNVNELSNVLDYVNKDPKLEYLKKPLNYKLEKLTSDKTVNASFNDVFIDMPEYAQFTLYNSEGSLSQITSSVVNGISSYNALSMNPNFVTNQFRKNAINKINELVNNPVDKAPMQFVKRDNDSVLIDLGMSPHQSSNNGCWSCSLNTLLKAQGVNLTQEEIRAFKPSCESKFDAMDLSLTRLRDRIVFSERATLDQVNSIFDYTELVHKTVKNAVIHQLDINTRTTSLKNVVKKIINQFETPVSFVDGGHYRTIVGFDGDYVIYHDSLNTPPYNGEDVRGTAIEAKYPNYCVCKFENFTYVNRCELAWVEKEPTLDKLRNDISKCELRKKSSVSAGSVVMVKRYNEFTEEFISIPDNLAKDLAIGPFEKQNVVINEAENDIINTNVINNNNNELENSFDSNKANNEMELEDDTFTLLN